MTLTSCSGERPPRNTATRVSFLPLILHPITAMPLRGHQRCAGQKLPSVPRAAQSARMCGVTHRTVRAGGAEFAVYDLPGDSPAGMVQLVWAHGWGHSHANMLPLARAM